MTHHSPLITDTAPLILGLDTASLGGSVCLMRGPDMIESLSGDAKVSHSSTLLSDIDRILKNCRVSIQDVTLFAASVGPGSFTGLRIGLATVKGLAATLSRPCAGIPTLQAVALAAGTSRATVALLPAGRGELFAQLLSVSEDGRVTEYDVPVHLPPKTVMEKYGHLRNVKWAGAGAYVHSDLIKQHAGEKGIDFHADDQSSKQGSKSWHLAAGAENLAREVASLAQRRFQDGESETPESLRAIYVRPSDPELKEDRQ